MDCATLIFQFESLAREMGVPLAGEKTTRPTTSLRYLGFEIDTVDMTISINGNKVEVLVDMVQKSVSREKVILEEMQSL